MIGIWMPIYKYTEVVDYTLVDRELFEALSKWKWHMQEIKI